MGKGARNRALRASQPPKPAKVPTPIAERSVTRRREASAMARVYRAMGFSNPFSTK